MSDLVLLLLNQIFDAHLEMPWDLIPRKKDGGLCGGKFNPYSHIIR